MVSSAASKLSGIQLPWALRVLVGAPGAAPAAWGDEHLALSCRQGSVGREGNATHWFSL